MRQITSMRLSLLFTFALALMPPSAQADDELTALLDDAIDAPHRSEDHRARDRYRHPKETMMFFGLRPEMTVIEISPGAGWYTEILGPVLRKKGRLIAAVPVLAADAPDTMKRRDRAFSEMIASDPILYGSTRVHNFDAAHPIFSEDGEADLIVTFRNVHNWAKSGDIEPMFSAFFSSLKSGGVLGVVEHRARPGTTTEKQITSGYMTEDYVIGAAQRAGFQLAARSEINSNPLDSTDHPGGVWNLPPSLRGVPAREIQKYLDIGESDRMTLRFTKP